MFCYVTANLMPLRESYWAPLAAVVVLYPEPAATRKAGSDRFVGTFVGSLIGWASAEFWHGHVLIYGAGVMLAVALCSLLGLGTVARLSAVAVTVITIVPHAEPPHLVALYRFVEVSYGVACAYGYTTAVEYISKRRRERGSW
jgi:uncharacterized membrane protein YccC